MNLRRARPQLGAAYHSEIERAHMRAGDTTEGRPVRIKAERRTKPLQLFFDAAFE
jgi:hypothetical protein